MKIPLVLAVLLCSSFCSASLVQKPNAQVSRSSSESEEGKSDLGSDGFDSVVPWSGREGGNENNGNMSKNKNKNESKAKGANKDECDCRESTDTRTGDCYELTEISLPFERDSTKYLRPCVRRNCTTKFECVGNGEAHTHQCIRKFATERVKRYGRKYKDMFWCRAKRLRRPRPFLVPYEA